MRTRAVVFDFDGVVLETEEAQYRAWKEIWAGYGEELALLDWAPCIGAQHGPATFDPFEALCARTGLHLPSVQLRDRARATASALLEEMPVSAGVEVWLDEAAAAGWRTGIASSAPRSWVTGHLGRLGLLGCFETIVCFDDCGASKPDPASYLLACSSLGTEPRDSVAVEDSAHGLTAARAAGLQTVAVPTPMTAHMDLSAADLVLGSLADATLASLPPAGGRPLSMLPPG